MYLDELIDAIIILKLLLYTASLNFSVFHLGNISLSLSLAANT